MNSYVYSYTTPSGNRTGDVITHSTKLVLLEAEKLGVSWKALPNSKVIELTWNNQTTYFHIQIPFSTHELGEHICNDKPTTAMFLAKAGLSVPKGYFISPEDPESLHQEIFEALSKPLVVKPTNGNQGDNITIGINTLPDLTKALHKAFSYNKEINQGAIIEEFFKGKEYRILATQEKVIGIIHRVPANVVGDGTHSIAELIELKNQDPRRGTSHSDGEALMQITVDQAVERNLAQQNLTIDSIIPKGQQIFLRKMSNMSKGGDTYDVTDTADESVCKLAVTAMKAIPGLALAGIDFMTTDLTQPQTADSYRIIEINASPGFDLHDCPYEGKNRHAAREFLYLLFPELRAQSQ